MYILGVLFGELKFMRNYLLPSYYKIYCHLAGLLTYFCFSWKWFLFGFKSLAYYHRLGFKLNKSKYWCHSPTKVFMWIQQKFFCFCFFYLSQNLDHSQVLSFIFHQSEKTKNHKNHDRLKKNTRKITKNVANIVTSRSTLYTMFIYHVHNT